MTKNRNKTFFNQLFIGLTMFGTLVGVGFASGKEVWYYFARFGNVAYLVILLTGLLFFVISYLFFTFGKNFHISTVHQCNGIIFGKFALVGEMILVLSNLVLLASMFAGANSLFEIVLPNTPYRLASVISGLITFVVVCFGFKGITKANMFITPLLLLAVTVIVLYGFISGVSVSNHPFTAGDCFGSMAYAVLFVSSNMFFSGFIFARMGRDFSQKEVLGGSAVGAICLILSLLGITITLFSYPSVIYSDMPLVAIAYSMNNVFAYFMLIIVWLGLLTTAFALLYTIANWLKTYTGKGVFAPLLATIIALILSGIGFASFVEYVYPVMGIMGMFFIGLVAHAQFKTRKKRKKGNSP